MIKLQTYDVPAVDGELNGKTFARRTSAIERQLDDTGFYLAEIGEVPLLSASEEKQLAQRIVDIRAEFKSSLLDTHYMQDAAVQFIQLLVDRKLKLEGKVEATGNSRAFLRKLRNSMPENLKTLKGLLAANETDFKQVISFADQNATECKSIQSRILRRRQSCIKLFSEVNIREKYLTPYLKELSKVNSVLQALVNITTLTTDEQIKKTKLIQATQATPKELQEYFVKIIEAHRKFDQQKNEFVSANLRLVVSIAKKYRGKGVEFDDLIQAGNTGLMRALDKFEWQRGYKFSTYATWWIRQALSKEINDHGKTVRLPVYLREKINKVNRASAKLSQKTGCAPTLKQLAKATKLPISKIQYLIDLDRATVSLDQSFGNGEISWKDSLEDEKSILAKANPETNELIRRIRKVCDKCLNEREQYVINARFGLDGTPEKTLKEVGTALGVTQERARQIEAKAIRKMQVPYYATKLESHL